MSRHKTAMRLPNDQKRLRHLECVGVRHLAMPDGRLFSGYFTLHDAIDGREFYRSEVLEGTCNPTWRNVDVNAYQNSPDLGSSAVVVRVWSSPAADAGEPGATQPLQVLAWDVDLYGLQFIRKKLEVGEPLAFSTRSIVFQLRDGWYTADQPSPAAEGDGAQSTLPGYTRVNTGNLKRMYALSYLNRIATVQRSIGRARAAADSSTAKIVELMSTEAGSTSAQRQCEQARLRVRHLQEELIVQRAILQKRRDTLAEENSVREQRRRNLRECLASLLEAIEALNARKAKHSEQRQTMGQVVRMVGIRQASVILQLHSIYPIVQATADQCSILGILLPNSDFAGGEDDVVATALGYVAHMVFMISKYLNLPLRYPILPMCSRSSIQDLTSSHLADKDRTFPLYMNKAKERSMFEDAVYLLNKDIQQLVNYAGAKVPDLRNTLPNLRVLMLRFHRQHQQYVGAAQDAAAGLAPATTAVSIPGKST